MRKYKVTDKAKEYAKKCMAELNLPYNECPKCGAMLAGNSYCVFCRKNFEVRHEVQS